MITLPVRPQQSSYNLGSISSQLSVLSSSPQVSYMAGLARARPREEQSVCIGSVMCGYCIDICDYCHMLGQYAQIPLALPFSNIW